MDSVFHDFNLPTFATQLNFEIKIWSSCVVKYIICGGKIKIFNYRNDRIAWSQIKKDQNNSLGLSYIRSEDYELYQNFDNT